MAVKAKRARRARTSSREADRALAVAYVNVAVAIASFEHCLTELVGLIAPHRDWAPPPRKRERTRP